MGNLCSRRCSVTNCDECQELIDDGLMKMPRNYIPTFTTERTCIVFACEQCGMKFINVSDYERYPDGEWVQKFDLHYDQPRRRL